jgi:DNA repair exonuclease SbcCD ATPase subunit
MKDHYHSEYGKKEQLLDRLYNLNKEKIELLERIDLLNNVKLLLQNVSDYARDQIKHRIEDIVTTCLQYIFENDIVFSVEIKEVRGRPDAEFYIVENINGENFYTKPQEARGGGVVDIISIALRIAMIQCSNLDIEGPIFLDEPAKHLSEEYVQNVARFLKQITKELDRQIIIVTHERHLSEIADKWYRIEMNCNESRIVFES